MKTFNITPCAEVGTIKMRIKEAILEGEIQNNHDEAFEFMLKIANELGLETNSSLSS